MKNEIFPDNPKAQKSIGNTEHVDAKFRELVSHGKESFPVDINDYSADPYKEYGMHWHNEMEIVRVNTGAVFFIINQQEVHAFAGDYVVVPPGAQHCLWSDEYTGELLTITTMLFDPKILSCNTEDNCQKLLVRPLLEGTLVFSYYVKKGFDRHKYLDDIFGAICDCYNQDDAFSLIKIKGEIYNLMYELLNQKITAGTARNKNSIVLAKAFEYVQLNYNRDISPTFLSDFFSYSEPYFMRLFKNHFGVSFVKYVNNVRLEKARELLVTTAMPVVNVGYVVGFTSSSYFIRVFRSKYGVSPNKYRLMEFEGLTNAGLNPMMKPSFNAYLNPSYIPYLSYHREDGQDDSDEDDIFAFDEDDDEELNEKPAKKTKGRPRKQTVITTPNKSAAKATSIPTAKTSAKKVTSKPEAQSSDGSAPKKRGRKPKSAK